MTFRNLAIALDDGGRLKITDVGDPLDLWEATRRFFNERRPSKKGRNNFTYPETTNGDVRQLAEVWQRVHDRVWRSDLARAGQFRTQWKEARSAIEVATAGADPAAVFVSNEEFWLRWTKRQAIYLSAVRDMPSRWDMVVDSVKTAVVRLPENIGAGVRGAVDVGESVATSAGRVVAAPVRGLFDGLFGPLGKPLLIGAAVVGGVILVPRLLGSRSKPESNVPDGGGEA